MLVFFWFGAFNEITPLLIFLAIIVFETSRLKSLKWLLDVRFLLMLLISAFIASAWYGFQLVFNHDLFVGSQQNLSSTLQIPDDYFFSELLLKECFWAFSPVVFVLALISILFWSK